MKNIKIIISEYLEATVGFKALVEPIGPNDLKRVPLALTSLYDFYTIHLFQQQFTLVVIKETDDDKFIKPVPVSAEQLRRHFEMIQKEFGWRCIAVTGYLDTYTRKRFIEKRIPFIVPGKQMYLPELLIDIKEITPVNDFVKPTMAPATQFLLLYHLQRESIEDKIFKELAEKFNYDNMTISRAAFYMHNTGLCEVMGTRERYIKFKYNKKQLWEMALPHLSTPVKLTEYYSGFPIDSEMKYSGFTALAHYTTLNAGPLEYRARKPQKIQYYESVNLVKSNELESNICIETWKYDPCYLSEGDSVDRLSLYLSLRDRNDERIQIALNELLSGVSW